MFVCFKSNYLDCNRKHIARSHTQPEGVQWLLSGLRPDAYINEIQECP